MNFDLVSLEEWQPAMHVCDNCRYIFREFDKALEYNQESRKHICTLCGKSYSTWAEIGNISRAFEDVLKFARIAKKCPPHASVGSMEEPLSLLYQALAEAKHFVHFLTFSVDTTFLGALSLVASKGVTVRGIVGNGKNHEFVVSTAEALTNSLNSWDMRFVVGIEGHNITSVAPPHTKLIIIDGLIAFLGSANLTMNGWMNASKSTRSENIQIESRTEQVIKLNNDAFFVKWQEHQELIWKYFYE